MAFIEIGQNFGVNNTTQYVFLFIISLIWILLILFSLRKHGWEKTIRYFFPMMIAALFIEAAGVASGRFYYPGYLIYFSVLDGSVPLIILLGWSSNLYLFLNLYPLELLQSSPLFHSFYINLKFLSLIRSFQELQITILSLNNWYIFLNKL